MGASIALGNVASRAHAHRRSIVSSALMGEAMSAASDCRTRAKSGIRRSNSRLKAAYEQYPPGSSELALRKAEQKHINRLRSWSPECGFNILTAVKGRRGPAQRAQLQFRRAVIAGVHEKTRQRVAQYRDACWAQMHHAG
jgi:hypothetical protein